MLLAFSGAFLLSLTLFELLPEAYAHLDPRIAGICIAGGILLQIVLEFFSKGAEHGHVHGSAKQHVFPWPLFLSLCLHAFLEGIPLEHNQHFLWGVVVHKTPVALILGSFLLASQLNRRSVWLFMILFAAMTPLGAIAGGLAAIQQIYPYLMALVIGIVLHVATVILFESSEGHAVNLRKLAVIIAGMILAFLL